MFPVLLAVIIPIGAIKLSQALPSTLSSISGTNLSARISTTLSLAKPPLKHLFTVIFNASQGTQKLPPIIVSVDGGVETPKSYPEALLTEVRTFEEQAHATALLEELSRDVELTLRETAEKIAAREKTERENTVQRSEKTLTSQLRSVEAPQKATNTHEGLDPSPTKSEERRSARASLKRSSVKRHLSPLSAEQRNKILFISGKIAVSQPSLKDVGKLARELVEISEQEGLDPFFIAAIVSVESRFLEKARSSAGATGLMQLMPATAKFVAKTEGITPSHSLTDSRYNLALGIHYIRSLEEQFRGNRFLALAAYNWGPTNVVRVRTSNRIPRSVQNYASTILKRTLLWRQHFEKALESTTELEQVAMLPAPRL